MAAFFHKKTVNVENKVKNVGFANQGGKMAAFTTVAKPPNVPKGNIHGPQAGASAYINAMANKGDGFNWYLAFG